MKYKKLTQFPSNSENPFLLELLSSVKKGTKKILAGKANDTVLLDVATGELKGHNVLMIEYPIDKTKFTKLYEDGIRVIYGLSKTALRVFSYIAKSIQPDKDFIYFDTADCAKEVGFKAAISVTQGLSELIENKFIARTEKTYKYYINPNMFFNGDRLTIIKTYKKDTSTSEPKTTESLPETKLMIDNLE
jgi:hypothetical protein